MPRPRRVDDPGATHSLRTRRRPIGDRGGRRGLRACALPVGPNGCSVRDEVPRLVLSPEPLAPADHVAARQPLASNALARNAYGADVQSAVRARRASVPGSFRVETRSADDNYFLELGRYLPLNPVRAGLCIDPADWPWSSYAATVGLKEAPWFFDAAPLVDGRGSSTNYVAWVAEGLETNPLDDLGVPLPPPRSLTGDALARRLGSRHCACALRARIHEGCHREHLGVGNCQVGRRLA